MNRGQIAQTGANVGPEPCVAVGGVAIVVSGDQSARSQVQGETTRLNCGLAAGTERPVNVERGPGLDQFKGIDLIGADRTAGTGIPDPAVIEFAAQAQRPFSPLGTEDGAQANDVVGGVKARPHLVVDPFVPETGIAPDLQGRHRRGRRRGRLRARRSGETCNDQGAG